MCPDYVRKLLRQFPEIEVAIFQYRPAWFEQLVLHMAGIPFTVYNSPYGATESTGPLPFLRDLRQGHAPILVGRKQFFRSDFDSSIIDYLLNVRQVESDVVRGSNEEKALSQLYANLLTTKLHTALLVLRYDDEDAWNQFYRRQCLHAASAKQSWVLGSWFSVWSERTVSQHQLGPFRCTIPQALTEVRRCYEILDIQLSLNQFILGGSKPTFVDALLFDHLANALCDVHLVGVLPDFPNLAKFFDKIYDQYFSKGDDTWMLWNRSENRRNAFMQVPSRSMHSLKFKESLELIHDLMQALSLPQHGVTSVLNQAKGKRHLGEIRPAKDEDNNAIAAEATVKNASDVSWQAFSRNGNTLRNGVIVMTVGVVALSLFKSKRNH